MSALSIQVPFPVFQGRDGQPLENGYIWIGEPNLNPQTNPVVAYYDAALTIVAPQPLRTINGYVSRAGTPAQIYVGGVNFSILVQDSNGSMVYNFPDGSGISPDACGVTYDPPFTGAVPYPVCEKLEQTVSVMDFGAVGDGVTNDTAAFLAAVAALPATGGTIYVPDATGYLITSSIECAVPVLWQIGNTTITANLTGYLFNLQANRSGIEGAANSVLKAGTGCTALIFNNQTLNCHYWNLELDLNNVANVVGLHHYGGWYLSAKNLHVDVAKEAVSASTMIVEGYWTSGDPLSTGSYGGAFVSTYDNIIGGKVRIRAVLPQKTTTLTFTGCSLTSVIASDSIALTFLQPIIQGNQNFFDLTNVSGLTCIGGDYEISGGGQVFVLQDVNCKNIVSIGNMTANVTPANYLVGSPPGVGCIFSDSDIVGAEDEFLRFGSLPEFALRNSGFTSKMRYGLPFSGSTLVASNNIRLISTTQGNLDNTAANGSAVILDQSGQVKIMVASAGSNPRTLTQYALFDGAGLKLYQLPISAATAGQFGLWYDTTDGNRVKFVP